MRTVSSGDQAAYAQILCIIQVIRRGNNMSAENKSLVLWLIDEVFRRRHYAAIDDLYAPDCYGTSPDGPLRGRKDFRTFFDKYARAFPDFHFEVNLAVAEGDTVVVHYTFIATHTATLGVLPATGARIRVSGVVISRIAGLLVSEQHFIWDNLGPGRMAWPAIVAENRSCQFNKSPHGCARKV
jgi:predicted SnoaL-like aldol condensation-catalyzing enzyme